MTEFKSKLEPEEVTPVQEFYKNKCIFITGASGFVGKTVVEKLLRSCDNLNRIYILLRPKRNLSVQQRLENLIRSSIFDKIRKTNPSFWKKISAISGDTTLPFLGISKDDQLLLEQQIHIVFHCAATIKFNESLSNAMQINFHGTKRLLQLCQRMTQLCALVHISTAYTNSERREIDEIIYPFISKSKIDQLLLDLETYDENTLEKMTPGILKEKPNTYVFTKAVVENYLEQYKDSLPIAIVRPSIVTATVSEPVPGWIDNYSALSGLLVFVGKGLLRSFNINGETLNDLIPADYLANTIILAGWKKSIQWQTNANSNSDSKDTQVTIYNCCSKNPISFTNFSKIILPAMYENPFDNVFWYPTMDAVQWSWVHWFHDFLFHWFPAYCMDSFNNISNADKKKINMVRIYNKVKDSTKVLNYFMTREWKFHTKNVHKLNESLSPNDQLLFPTFVKDIQWTEYLRNYTIGLRKYTLKEEDRHIQKAKRNMQRKYWLHNIVLLLYFPVVVIAMVYLYFLFF